VESFTALAENSHGTLGIIYWVSENPVKDMVTNLEYEKNRYSDRCLAPTN